MKQSRLLLHPIMLLLAASLLASGPALAAEQKDLAYFFKKPQYASLQLSPDGRKMAVMAPLKDRMNLVVMNVDMSDGRFVTNVKAQDVNGFMWANDDRLLFFMDKDGNESLGVFAVNADGSKSKTLVKPFDGQSSVVRYTEVIDRLAADDEHVLVISNERRASNPDVYRMNIYTGRKFIEQKNPGDVNEWIVNWDGRVIGGSFQDGPETGVVLLNEETGALEEVTRVRYDQASWTPVGLRGDGETGWVSSYLTPQGETRDKAALYEFNFATLEMGDLVFEHEQVDVSSVLLSRKTRDLVGVAYTYGVPERRFTDPRWQTMMAGIEQALPETMNTISSIDDEETIAIVTAASDRQPPQYYLFDVVNRSLRYLTETMPWVDANDMAEMQSVTVTARDGMLLQGYVTLPPGSDGKNLPTIVHPHGGPWARDGWGFNSEIQFLANRGYAVLQVNFRGSTGFGMNHLMSSRKQWGRAMQTDVSDMLQWAIDEGIADPDRVCIYGASYGGFATMAGLAFSPELYQCGINYVGVTDLIVFQKTMPDAWESSRVFMHEMVGNPKTEKEFLEQWSPSHHADKIRAPVFMAYGKKDPRVHMDNLKVMEDALEDAGKKEGEDFWTMVKKDEGHGFRKQENVYDYYGRVDSFLAQYLRP